MVERNKSFQIAANVIMILLSAMCIVPFILLIMSSITKENILLKYGYSFWPREISFDAYKTLLVDSGSIVRGYIISALVTVVGTVANLTLTTLFAYPLSRKELPGKAFFSFVIFFTMLFNGGLVPSYMMWTGIFHIKNTIWALIVPNLLMGAFYVIMMRTYFTTNIPDAFIEAARIDGAGEWRILAKIVLPMSTPIIATLALLVGLGYWNDWFQSALYISDSKLVSLQALLNNMMKNLEYIANNPSAGLSLQQYRNSMPSESVRMAIAIIIVIPIACAYPFFQKYFISGLTVGAVKG